MSCLESRTYLQVQGTQTTTKGASGVSTYSHTYSWGIYHNPEELVMHGQSLQSVNLPPPLGLLEPAQSNSDDFAYPIPFLSLRQEKSPIYYNAYLKSPFFSFLFFPSSPLSMFSLQFKH